MKEFRLEPTPKHVRALYRGQTVVDSENALLLYGAYYYPHYLFPVGDIKAEIFYDQCIEKPHRWLGTLRQADLEIDGRLLTKAVGLFEHSGQTNVDFSGLAGVRWNSMDEWYEEAEEVFVHPHDPYHRIDVMRSNRRIKVVIAGVTIAETDHPVMLLETDLPVRWYIPKVDVRLDLLQPSKTETGCAYKGFAKYYSAMIGDRLIRDVAWYYNAPFREALPIASHLSFFDERFEFYVDGMLQPTEVSHWTDENPDDRGNDPIDG